MSEPTYRIEVSIDPHATKIAGEPLYPWQAMVRRITDDYPVVCKYGATSNEALAHATDWIREEAQRSGAHFEYHATEDGELVSAPEPQSLRVAP